MNEYIKILTYFIPQVNQETRSGRNLINHIFQTRFKNKETQSRKVHRINSTYKGDYISDLLIWIKVIFHWGTLLFASSN